MPSVSKKQHNLMAAVANNPAFAKKAGIPQRVGADFLKADKGRKFAKGGDMKESKRMMEKEVAFMKKKGAPKSMLKHEMSEAKGYAKGGGCELKGKTKGQQFADGGMSMASIAPSIAPRNKPTPITQFGKGPSPTATTRPGIGIAPKPQAKPSMSVAPTPTVGRPGTRSENWSPQTGYVGADRPKVITAKPAPKPLPMPTQRKGGFSMPPEAKAKVGDALAKMMGDVRAKGAKEMASKGGTGAQAPNLSMPMPRQQTNYLDVPPQGIKKGGSVKKFAKGGSIDGCATKGKTKGRII